MQGSAVGYEAVQNRDASTPGNPRLHGFLTAGLIRTHATSAMTWAKCTSIGEVSRKL